MEGVNRRYFYNSHYPFGDEWFTDECIDIAYFFKNRAEILPRHRWFQFDATRRQFGANADVAGGANSAPFLHQFDALSATKSDAAPIRHQFDTLSVPKSGGSRRPNVEPQFHGIDSGALTPSRHLNQMRLQLGTNPTPNRHQNAEDRGGLT